jgi:glutaredoxin 2
MLDQKQYSADEVEGLQKCFVFYVKMPKGRWKDIERAEANTVEGQKIFSELKEEYKDKYLPPLENSMKVESHNSADLEYGIEHAI